MDNNKPKYKCSLCGAETPRDKLTVKKVVFQTMGDRGKVFRARVVDRLCPVCLSEDFEYNLPKRTTSAV